MTQSFGRPSIVTSRSNEREDDAYLRDVRRALNAFPTLPRSYTSPGDGAYHVIWQQQYSSPGLIRASYEVAGYGTATEYLDMRARNTFLTSAGGAMTVPVGTTVDYRVASGALMDCIFQYDPAGILYIAVRDNGTGNSTRWRCVVQVLENY